ncbi:hypothetical protein [Roseovarius arcticus]|uniref:hypothetical protein n=1 Tax=Roseovarius arcticus TaxID=2547404 RepID=UPI0011103B1A|nr:hypothetical protein [Roseovarius arcticus]
MVRRITVETGPHSQAQGDLHQIHEDGRLTVDTGSEMVTGTPLTALTQEQLAKIQLELNAQVVPEPALG